MSPILKLHFIKGLQLETDWIIGYGPRIIGSESMDLKILEPKAPDHCFELIPTEKGNLYQTNNNEIVLINDKKMSNKILENGDEISIFNTTIKVSFLL